MTEPVWLPVDLVVAIQAEQLAIFGGSGGIRDAGLLSSALDRPRNKWAYGERNVCSLAAAYGFGISSNHPFVDGNKRTALLAIDTFLGLNGLELTADETSTVLAFEALASGRLTEAELATWITANSTAA